MKAFFPNSFENVKAYPKLEQRATNARTLLAKSIWLKRNVSVVFHNSYATNVFAFCRLVTPNSVKNLICTFVYKFVYDWTAFAFRWLILSCIVINFVVKHLYSRIIRDLFLVKIFRFERQTRYLLTLTPLLNSAKCVSCSSRIGTLFQ